MSPNTNALWSSGFAKINQRTQNLFTKPTVPNTVEVLSIYIKCRLIGGKKKNLRSVHLQVPGLIRVFLENIKGNHNYPVKLEISVYP